MASALRRRKGSATTAAAAAAPEGDDSGVVVSDQARPLLGADTPEAAEESPRGFGAAHVTGSQLQLCDGKNDDDVGGASWLAKLCSLLNSLLRSILGAVGRGGEPCLPLTPRQEHAVYSVLGGAIAEAYDEHRDEHVSRLRTLWSASLGDGIPFPSAAGGDDEQSGGLRSERWKEMGWQGVDPGTDVRGGGVMGLDNLVFLSQRYPGVYMKLLDKSEGQRSDWEYPFSAAGMNVTFMLVDVFGIREAARRHQQELNDDGMPSPKQNRPTLRVLLEIEAECGDIIDAFHEVYCVAFEMLDNEWLRVGASYLQFNGAESLCMCVHVSGAVVSEMHVTPPIAFMAECRPC